MLRVTVVYGGCSNAEECNNVAVAMRGKSLGRILRELAGDRHTATRADTMDVDVDEKPIKVTAVPKTGTLVPGSVVQPKKTIDLESMVFSQGDLMLNKKCKLPDGSFKRTKKGYEIHVPAPKSKPVVSA